MGPSRVGVDCGKYMTTGSGNRTIQEFSTLTDSFQRPLWHICLTLLEVVILFTSNNIYARNELTKRPRVKDETRMLKD